MVESIAELRQICRKTKGTLSKEIKVQDFWYIKFLRYCSIYFVKLAAYTSLTANGMTFISLLVVLAGGLLLAFQKPIYSFIGIFLIILFSILDCSDGDLARYRKESSLIGRYFDLWVHGIESTAIFVGFTFGIYHAIPSLWVIAAGFTTVSSFLLIALSGALKKFHINYFAAVTKNTEIIQETKLKGETKKRFGISLYAWKNTFSFFFVPYLILITIILDMIYPPFSITLMGYTHLMNWRFALLLFVALYSTIAVIIKVRNTLKLRDKLILPEGAEEKVVT